MRYAVDVLDESRVRVAELTGMAAARLRERINAPAVLALELLAGPGWEHIRPGVSYLRLRELPGGERGTFRVIEASAARVRERTSLTVTARHVLGDAADELFAGAADYFNRTPGELLAAALAHSSFAAGTAEFTAGIPYARFEYEPVLTCLLRICSLSGGELELDEAAGTISIRARIGRDAGGVFRYGTNLASVRRTASTGSLANRIYGVGGGDPPMDIAGAAGSGGLPYVEDADSIARWGLREAAVHDPTVGDVTNLMASPVLDGVYSGGICAHWTAGGGAAVSRNEDPAFLLYGRSSQRVRTSATGQGIAQTVAVTPGKVYSLLAHIIIASGTVRVRVDDGTAVYQRPGPEGGTGLAVVRIENWKAIGSTVTVRIAQEGSGSADFCVDSVQMTEGAAVKPFAAGRSADTLLARASEELAARKTPEITYEVDLADRTADAGEPGVSPGYGLGDTVRIADPVLGIDVTTRVVEREEDLLRPGRIRVRLDSPSCGLAEVIAALRESRDEAVRRMRAVQAAGSTAAETGSARQGFWGQSFRFDGTVSPDGWNGVVWTDGILRAGDAWFTVGAGGVSGLAGASTHFFFFDRTAPGTFGRTMSSAEAEGEDRILVFAVAITSPPEPCTVHTGGIVRG